MKETNCPNCGAPITGRTCEYCGTRFSDPEPISACDCSGMLVFEGLSRNAIMTTNEVRELLGLKKINRGVL